MYVCVVVLNHYLILLITGFMLPGAICPTSSPTVLEFWPEANTTFTCLSREGDKESGLTFAVDNSVYVGLDQLGPDVKFVYQSRRSQDDRFSVTTTLIFHDGASGSTLSCCYVDGTNISWRESFLLLCICPSKYPHIHTFSIVTSLTWTFCTSSHFAQHCPY